MLRDSQYLGLTFLWIAIKPNELIAKNIFDNFFDNFSTSIESLPALKKKWGIVFFAPRLI